MERLTKRMDHGIIMAPGYDFGIDPDDYVLVQEILARLAAYEETGLDPEDFKRAFTEATLLKLTAQYLGTSPERLRELAKAEQEGRLVVLPCKVGDSLYRIRRFKRGSNWKKEAVHIMSTTLTMNNVANVLFGDVMGKTVFLTREEAEAALVADINVGSKEGGKVNG